MATFASFYPFVKPFCPGAPEPAIDRALREAAIEFAVQSNALRELLTASLVPGQVQYEIAPEDGRAEVSTVLEAKAVIGGTTSVLEPSRLEGIDTAEQDDPTSYCFVPPEMLVVHPVPDRAGGLQITIATRPRDTASALDDRLYRDWRTGVVAGALLRLLLVPGTSYLNPQMAAEYSNIFTRQIERAFHVAAQGHVRARLRVKPCL